MHLTPIHLLSEDDNRIFVKREDLIPFSFGGNKARKALYFFNEIDRGSYDCVVTYGSSSSNHCRVVANMAAQRKMPCYIISPAEASHQTYNSKLIELFKADITLVPIKEVHDTIEHIINSLKDAGHKPYFIEGGGHGNLGTQAYIDCYEEICSYEAANNVLFDYIFFASGTGTTHAGLVCGQLMHGDRRNIIGLSIARKNPRGRNIVIESIKEYFLQLNYLYSTEQIERVTNFLDDYICDGYGSNNDQISGIIKDAMINYGIPFDSTYTGKAFAGMYDYIKKEKIHNSTILFIHTGGTPLFFNTLEALNS